MTGFAGHPRGSAAYRRLIVGLFCAGVATFAQVYSPQAVLPLIGDDLGVSAATSALTVSAATLGIAVGVIPWSIAADRVGRVPAMAAGIVVATLLGLVAPWSSDIGVLLGLRLVEGLALGAVPAVALAYLSEEVRAGHTAAAAGSYISGTTVGGLAGRLIAGPLGDLVGWRLGVGAVSLVCTVAAVLFLALTPRARGFVPGRMRAGRGPGFLTRLRLPFRSPVQLVLYALAFLLMGAFVAVYNYLGFHLAAPPFLLPTAVVTLLFLAYLAGTATSAWAGTLAVRFGRRRILLLATGVMAAGTALLLVPAPPVMVAGLVVFTGGFFGVHSIASGWTPAAAPPVSRAQASSLYSLWYYVGSSLLGWALGLVFGQIGWEALILCVLGLCAIAAVLARAVLPGEPARAGS